MRARALASGARGGRGTRAGIGGTAPTRGFILTEVVAGLVLTGALLAAMAGLVVAHHRASDHYLSHHQAQLAAESYVECVRAGCPPPETEGVTYQVGVAAGQGEWTGLTRLTVTAVVQAKQGRTAGYTLTTYLPEDTP
ncbi:MAG TPA: hypothetical protein VM243_00235 [Phycisphaerae bacterium]|nr:hypothetical protein [Phycisphaerae bacterium]